MRMLMAALVATMAASTAADAKPDAVPFELDRNVILVPVRVAGRGPYLAMIDTGTDPSAIDPALAKELGLKLGASGEIDGAGTESAQASETMLPDVALGPVVAKNVAALAGASVSTIGKALGKPVRIILGKSFLDHRIVQIDFPGRVLRFPATAPNASRGSPDRAVLRFRYEDDVMLEGVRIDGKAVRAILDTGSNGSVKLTPEAVRALGLEAQATAGKTSESTGFRGSYSIREGKLESLDLGTIHVAGPAAVFWPAGTGHDGKPWDANIGNAVLTDFVVTLDAVHGILVIEKPK
jgi:predicted aspartyl protease